MCLSLLSLELLNIELFSGDNEQKILAKLPQVLNDSEDMCVQKQRVLPEGGRPAQASPPPSLGSLLSCRFFARSPLFRSEDVSKFIFPERYRPAVPGAPEKGQAQRPLPTGRISQETSSLVFVGRPGLREDCQVASDLASGKRAWWLKGTRSYIFTKPKGTRTLVKNSDCC